VAPLAAGRAKDGECAWQGLRQRGSSNQGGDIGSEEELQPGNAPTATMASGGRQQPGGDPIAPGRGRRLGVVHAKKRRCRGSSSPKRGGWWWCSAQFQCSGSSLATKLRQEDQGAEGEVLRELW
jgi:hypothetical protein